MGNKILFKYTVEKIVTYRVTSEDGKIQANGATEKEAVAKLEEALAQRKGA
jgi:phosphotransferase system HPr-like phosphotransfer protein